MMQQMLRGMGGPVKSVKLKVLHLDGTEEDISQQSSYSFQHGDIIEPIFGDYEVVIKCAGKRGQRNSDHTYKLSGYGAWVQGTINMKYGAKYYVKISDGIGALYWGDSGSNNDLCMMLGAEGGHGKRYAAGFYESDRDWASDFNRLGLGGNAGVCDSFGNSTGSPGEGSPGINNAISVDATGGSGGNVTGHGSTGGSGGGGGIGTGPDGGKTGGTGGYFAGGAVDWNQINVSGGGEGGMGYFGGGGGGSVVETSKNYWSGGGGGGGASYAGGVPSSFLINSSIDDASVTNIISQLNTDPDTVDTAFVTCVSAQKTGEKEQPYWVGHQYDGNYPAQH